MASVWKDPRSSYWVACFTDKDGRRLKRTTESTNRREAQKIADCYEKVARKKQTLRKVRDVISELVREIWGMDTPSVTTREHVANWLDEKKSSSAASTWNFYDQSLRRFVDFIGEQADESIDGIDRTCVSSFKAFLAKNLAPKTVNHNVKCLRMLFKAAKRDGLVSEDPAEFVETLKTKESVSRRPFSIAELEKVLAACGDEWRSMVLFGIYTGQRLADVATLKWANVQIERSELSLVTRKTGRRMSIPMAEPLTKHIATLPGSDDPNFPLHPKANAVVEKEGRTGTLSNQFTAILVAAGLRDASALSKKRTGKGHGTPRRQSGLSFHSLRHTAVTLLKEAGIPAAVVMEMIGHDSEQMSQHYTHVGREALAKAALALPDLIGEKVMTNVSFSKSF